MARPIEYGLEYFPMDVDFFDDPKIIMIEEQFKAKGIAIAVRTLCMIYRNGYFLTWNTDMPLVIAKRVGCDVNGALVTEVIKALVKCGFFDETVFNSCRILTSRGIQKRWLQIISDCKRKAVISLNHVVISEEMPVSSEETTAIQEETTQRKGEERKEKQKKEKGVGIAPAPHRFEILKIFFDLMYHDSETTGLEKALMLARENAEKKAGDDAREVQNVLSWFRKQCDKERLDRLKRADEKANTFFAHFNAIGWKNGKGQRIENIHSRIEQWLNEDKAQAKKSA